MAARPTTTLQLNAMTASLFSGTGQSSSGQSRTTVLAGLQRNIKIYYLPDEIDEADRKTVMSFWPVYGRSSDDRAAAWQTWTLSYLVLCFPQFVPKFRAMKSTEFELIEIPDIHIKEFCALVKQLEANVDGEYPPPAVAHLPITQATYNADFYACGHIEALYGYCALIVHLMGKNITSQTKDAIVNRRPQNIIDTFNCNHSRYVLKGAGRISDVGHTMVRNAWDLSDGPRKVVVEELALLKVSDDLSARIVSLLFRMLEYSGMQPALFISDFLSSCPWAIPQMPMLVPAYNVYVSSVVAYGNMDETMRPYTKLFHGNNTKIFHAKSMEDLIAVSVLWLSVNKDTMQGYTAPGGEKAKAAFAKLALSKGIDLNTGAMNPDVILAPDHASL